MINVLHVSDKLTVGSSKIHGVTRVFSWWIPRFDKSRYHVSVCSLRNRNAAGEYLEDRGIKVFYLNRRKFDPLTFTDVLRIIKREKINILHLHGYGAWTFGRLASFITGIPAVLHEHFHDPDIPLYQNLADYLFRRMKCPVFANSEAVADFCIRHRGIIPANVSVLYNGIPLNEFRRQSYRDDSTLRNDLGIPKNYKVVGTIGRLEFQKGVEYFLKAIPEIILECPETHFLVVGDGPLFGQLQDLSRQLGIQKHVHFTGFREDIPSILTVLDVIVITSLWEGGTTLTVFEAMSVGKNIVSTNVGGLKEVLRHDETALLIPPKDPSAIARSVLCYLKNSDMARKFWSTTQEAVKKYDVGNTVRQIEKIYELLIRSREEVREYPQNQR